MDGESMELFKWLGEDMSVKILLCLTDPSDLIRMSAVSKSWRKIVIGNGLCKKFCLRMFPEASSFARVLETEELVVEPMSTDDSVEWNCLEREHRVYTSLSKELISPAARENCISDAICASSTDRYPDEIIQNTLESRDRIGLRTFYWSSKGTSDPSVPEMLIYKLSSQLCLITEFHVHPYREHFEYGFPIYSAEAVRLHVGYSKVPVVAQGEERDEPLHVKDLCLDNFVWTYSSPEFPLLRENFLQMFKLPRPVLCIGGVVRVDLLGRVQTSSIDGLYYICINHVQVTGQSLSPAFDVEMFDEQGKCTLKYSTVSSCKSLSVELSEAEPSNRFHRSSHNKRSQEQLTGSNYHAIGWMTMLYDDSDDEYANWSPLSD